MANPGAIVNLDPCDQAYQTFQAAATLLVQQVKRLRPGATKGASSLHVADELLMQQLVADFVEAVRTLGLCKLLCPAYLTSALTRARSCSLQGNVPAGSLLLGTSTAIWLA